MLRGLVIVGMLGCLTTVAVAERDAWRAGKVGTVTAYEADGRTVIENRQCFKTRHHGSYDYVRCGQRLRDAVKFELCRKLGGGSHTWWYQIGDNRPTRSTVYCGRRY